MFMVIAVFALQTTASVAIAACNCPEKDQAMQIDDASGDMPCHGMDKAEADQKTDTKSDSNKMVNCDKCGCGDCNITAAAALPGQLSQNQIIGTNKAFLPVSDHMKSLFPYGIDYPPKRIS